MTGPKRFLTLLFALMLPLSIAACDSAVTPPSQMADTQEVEARATTSSDCEHNTADDEEECPDDPNDPGHNTEESR